MKLVTRYKDRMLHELLDLFVADQCELCAGPIAQRQGHALCATCWRDLPRNICACPRCAIPIARPGICGSCCAIVKPNQRTFAPLLHSAQSRHLLHRFKFHRDTRAGECLTMAMLTQLVPAYSYDVWPQQLIPAPMSWRRQVSRGFNHAAWLAHHLNKTVNVGVSSHIVARQHGPTQVSKQRSERHRLPRSTFTLRGPVPWQHVAIIDDVLTTGATTGALAGTLTRAGVSRVDTWCATRAVLGQSDPT